MGAAWREVRDSAQFDRVLDMIRGVKALGLEACCTLGMLTADQARRLKEAGLDAYNHNLDSSEAFYDRSSRPALTPTACKPSNTSATAGISVCCGGIVGMGETEDDRIGLLHTLATLPEPPEVGADQRAGRRRGNAAGRPPEGRDLGDGPHDRHRAHPDAPSDGPALRRTPCDM